MRKTWSAAGIVDGVGEGFGPGVGVGEGVGAGVGVGVAAEPEDDALTAPPPQPVTVKTKEKNSTQNTSFGPMGEGLLGTAGLNRCSRAAGRWFHASSCCSPQDEFGQNKTGPQKGRSISRQDVP